LREGQQVHAVTRRDRAADGMRRFGLSPIVADVTQPASLRELPACETVLYAIGLDRSSGKSARQVYVEGLASVLDALPAETGRLIYISSTGVYGDAAGEWIDEDSPCAPLSESGQAILEAERRLAAHPLGARSVVLRLAGLYGWGRIPRMESLRAGEPIAAQPDGHLNLIHVEDAARAVLAAERCSRLPALFCISDGHPALRRAFYEEAARLAGAPAPRFTEPESGSSRAQRGLSDKKISNARMLRELGLTPMYPSYRAGLAASFVGPA
jgi:nucleoside-diphosphate-sugar epimerase